ALWGSAPAARRERRPLRGATRDDARVLERRAAPRRSHALADRRVRSTLTRRAARSDAPRGARGRARLAPLGGALPSDRRRSRAPGPELPTQHRRSDRCISVRTAARLRDAPVPARELPAPPDLLRPLRPARCAADLVDGAGVG